MTRLDTPAYVVIAGGRIAALQALIAFRDLAGDRVAITVVAPEDGLNRRPMSAFQPFGKEPSSSSARRMST